MYFAVARGCRRTLNSEALMPAFEGVARWSETMSVALALTKAALQRCGARGLNSNEWRHESE